MTDPWADVREYREAALSAADMLDEDLYIYLKWFDGLLTDADALLAVARTGQAYKRIELSDDKTQQEQYFLEAEARREFWAALAALPEHLK